jgi:pectate lyase
MRALVPLSLLAAACAGQAGQRAVPPPTPGPPAQEAPPITVAGAIPVGWATVKDLGQDGTTGGGARPGVRVQSDAELFDALAGAEPRNILLMRPVNGTFEVGSNKTLIGAPGAILHGSLSFNGSVNVVVRNLKIVGYNCSDSEECKKGHDAVTLAGEAHHIWFDHCDISDGSDGNFDITEGSDYVTISWTKFSYSGRRTGAHQYSNLLGNADTASDTDRGHIRVTFHHDWWASNVDERMPRVRFGQVHVFNSLYTAAGNRYCIGLGAGASILVENNVFVGVKNPLNTTHYADDSSVLVARGNLFVHTEGTADSRGTAVFTPPYAYTLEPASAVRAEVTGGAGVPGPAGAGEDDE